MRFSTIFTVLACGAMTMAAVISPVALAKRDVEVEIVIGGLNDKCNEILPQFGLSPFPLNWVIEAMLTFVSKMVAGMLSVPRVWSVNLFRRSSMRRASVSVLLVNSPKKSSS